MPDPHTHEDARAAVLAFVGILSKTPPLSELELVAALERSGFTRLQAKKLSTFVPSAFGWALLKRMGLHSFASHYVSRDGAGGEVEVPIAREHYFTAALELAFNTLERGWTSVLPKETFTNVVGRSAEYGALNKLLHAGKSLKDAELFPLRVFGIPSEP